ERRQRLAAAVLSQLGPRGTPDNWNRVRKRLLQDNDRLERRLEEATARAAEARRAVNDANALCERQVALKHAEQTSRQNAERRLNSATTELTQLHERLGAAEAQLAAAQNDRDRLQALIDSARNELAAAQDRGA